MQKSSRARYSYQIVKSITEFILMGHSTACSCFSETDFDDHVLSTPAIIINNQGTPDVFLEKLAFEVKIIMPTRINNLREKFWT